MITEQEQEQIRFLSDTSIYQQACLFMRTMKGPLSRTQINGLLNVSLNNTYDQLKEFIQRQIERRSLEEHIRTFYIELEGHLRDLDDQAHSIIEARAHPSPEDVQVLKMLLA